jgi:hypothetical protein
MVPGRQEWDETRLKDCKRFSRYDLLKMGADRFIRQISLLKCTSLLGGYSQEGLATQVNRKARTLERDGVRFVVARKNQDIMQ